jgi:RNA polymerase sigma factor (sigma-70 family)
MELDSAVVLVDATEYQLMEQFRNGYGTAFQHFFDRYYKPLIHFSFAMVLDLDDAKDIVSEAFFALWVHHKNFYVEKAARNFLFTHARYKSFHCLNHREHIANHVESASLQEDVLSGIVGIMRRQEIRDLNRFVQANLHLLSRRCRQVLKLYLDGSTTVEIALKLNREPQTIRNIYTRSVDKLRELLLPPKDRISYRSYETQKTTHSVDMREIIDDFIQPMLYLPATINLPS